MSKRTCKPFTTEETKTILEMWKAGRSTSEIAKATGRSRGSIGGFISLDRKTHRYSDSINQEPPVTRRNIRKKVDLKVNGVKVGEAKAEAVISCNEPVSIVKSKELTPREMIKKLYNMGYRIENNQLVCIQKVVVKLADILNG